MKAKGWLGLGIVVILLVCSVAVTAYSNCDDEYRRGFDIGYDEGRDDGWGEGYKDGESSYRYKLNYEYDKNVKKYEDCYYDGYNLGYNRGFKKGYVKGFNEGRDDRDYERSYRGGDCYYSSGKYYCERESYTTSNKYYDRDYYDYEYYDRRRHSSDYGTERHDDGFRFLSRVLGDVFTRN